MATFGEIKTKIDETFINLYGKDEFKFFSNQFKKIVLENKDIAELYYIYNDLTENKGIPVDLVNDYINESVEYSQILVENNNKELSRINSWINRIDLHGDVKNIYETIDSVIYNNSIKNLENILESKKQISKTLSTPKKEVTIKESINLPLETMLKVANSKLNDEITNLSESEKNDIKEIVSLSKTELENRMENLKECIIENLKVKINESTESDLKNTIEKTVNKIQNSPVDFYNYYKLRQLQEGL
jgi:hypothetical protein